MRHGAVLMVVSVGLVAASALSAPAAWAQEEKGQYPTAISVVGGLSVGSSVGSRFGFGYGGDFGHGDGAAFAVGGALAHDITPRLTLEASGLYLDRGSSAWSADAGLRLNLKPSSESLVPYFAVSGGLYGQSAETSRLNPRSVDDFRGLVAPLLPGRGGRNGLPTAEEIRNTVDAAFTTTSSHGTDGMMTLGGGVVLSAGPHVFVRPDARAQILFSGNSHVLGLFTLNFGYRF
jgi:hypothetical protein